jgi:hypothetical protein
MNATTSEIDIRESILRRTGDLLTILLADRTTKKNIIWATDSYEERGAHFYSKKQIKPELVTGKYGLLIQPRAAKSIEEQRRRTKEKAEVFTPLKIVEVMNKEVEASNLPNKNNWQDYIRELKLEITCGEAPFIVSRYNPTAHGVLIKLTSRVGFLDKKLKIVSKYCDTKKDWLHWAEEAFKASYGYEWQGDNVLLARENLLYTLIDYYQDKFNQPPSLKIKEAFAEIISWNIFQMDGLRYVIPMTCFHEHELDPQPPLFAEQENSEAARTKEFECEGCKYNRPQKHNGMYVKIMDWSENKVVNFVDLTT